MNTIKTLTVNGKQYALTDDWARERLVQASARVDHLADACPIMCEARGQAISAADAANFPVRALRLYGRTVQSGSPAPDAPVDLDSAGHNGTITVHIAGKNLFSGFVKGVYLNPNTGLETTKASAAVTDYIPVVFDDSTNMYLSGLSADLMSCVYAYDADKTPVARIAANNVQRRALNKKSFITAFNSTKPIAFIRINIYENNNVTGTIDLVDSLTPQLELGTAETEYAPYTGQIFTAPTPDGLPGIPVSAGGNYTDENGQQWICDEIDLARGVYVQRIGKYTCTGEENWQENAKNYVTNGTRFDANPVVARPDAGAETVLSTHCVYCGTNKFDETVGLNMWVPVNVGKLGLRIVMPRNTTADELKAWLVEEYVNGTPVEILYALATPIETPLDEEAVAAYSSLRTYKPVTTMLNNTGAGMELVYTADTKTYIDNAIAKAISDG